jgi:hypothetical protein
MGSTRGAGQAPLLARVTIDARLASCCGIAWQAGVSLARTVLRTPDPPGIVARATLYLLNKSYKRLGSLIRGRGHIYDCTKGAVISSAQVRYMMEF